VNLQRVVWTLLARQGAQQKKKQEAVGRERTGTAHWMHL
jgi:hypothetical protein